MKLTVTTPGTCPGCGGTTSTGDQACLACKTAAAAAFWAIFDRCGGAEAWAAVQAELTVQRDGWPALDPATWQPVPGDTVKCGNRTDVPRRQRRHSWLDAGEGTLHDSDGSYRQVNVLICGRCGTTKDGKLT